MRTNKLVTFIAAVSISAILLVGGVAAAIAHGSSHGSIQVQRHDPNRDALAAARAATGQFHALSTAQGSGYALLKDSAGIACIAEPGVGAMGIHYVSGALVNSGQVEPGKPQALVYEPAEDGELHLVALEYVVFQKQWDATHSVPPVLFGQHFMLTPA